MLKTTYFLIFISLSNRYQVGDASIMRKNGVYALLAQNGQNSTKTKNSTKLKVVCHRFVQIYIIWEKKYHVGKSFYKGNFSAVEEPLDCLVGIDQVWSQIKTPNCKDTINSLQNKLFSTKPCLLLTWIWKALQCEEY